MINLVIAYDDKDAGDEDNSGLDYFYIACAENAQKLFAQLNTNLQLVSDDNLNKIYINEILISLKDSKFFFIAYSHGEEDALLHNNQNEAYIKSFENTHLFKNSLFYTWSCLCGQKLAVDLIEEGCYIFLGYDNNIITGTGEMNYFLECANYGLKKLVQGFTAQEVYYAIKDNYSRTIDFFMEQKNDSFIASFFRRNRDGLVLLGNPNITLSELEV